MRWLKDRQKALISPQAYWPANVFRVFFTKTLHLWFTPHAAFVLYIEQNELNRKLCLLFTTYICGPLASIVSFITSLKLTPMVNAPFME